MTNVVQDNCQWLSVTEETLFLHDGLIRVTDLVELPRDVNTVQEEENEVVSFDAKNPSELSERLMTVCGRQNSAYSRLLEYRLSAVRGYWNTLKRLAVEEQTDRDAATHEETIALLKKQGLWKEPEQAAFSTRIGLLLVLPLLQSQSKTDPHLCGVTAELLLNCLRDCPPLSLTKEPGDCLKGIESLLCSWLGESSDSSLRGTQQAVTDPKQRENAASALVALACARGHLKMFIHTVHLLQKLTDIKSLPVADILDKLLEMEGGQGQPTGVLGSKHVVCWGFEDMLAGAEKEAVAPAPAPANAAPAEKDKAEGDYGRSITCDGVFLYTTNSTGKGLAKLGTGLHGTIRGFVYSRNPDLGPGWVAWGNGRLMYRPASFDQDTETKHLVQLLNIHTLQPMKVILKPESYLIGSAMTSVNFCSDGAYCYWIWCTGSLSDKNAKGQNVFVEVFKLDIQDNRAVPLRERVLLQRKDENSQKAINETLLSRLRPHRGSAATATLVSITGSETVSTRKDDNESRASTSVGIALKTLLRTPIFCDGSTVVLLNPVPGSANTAAARSLFGSGGSLSSLRTLASNLCFNIEDGQFNTRTDLIDAPSCSLARGTGVLGLGVCFDVINNLIWTCSNDWVDQFYNPGHQAPHHIYRKLGISVDKLKHPVPPDNRPPLSSAVKQILQHVGSMCRHQLNNDLLHTPLGSYILQQHPVDVLYLERVCDILEKAILAGDEQITICALVVLQLIFKMSIFKKEKDKEIQLVKRSSALMWKLLTTIPPKETKVARVSAVQMETCQVIRAGLAVLYTSPQARNGLIHKLLAEGNKNPALGKLRDLVLVDFSDQLKNPALSREEMKTLRLTDELVHYILKLAVKESCALLRSSQKKNKEAFEELLTSVPRASSCLRYVMALQLCLLREAVLCQKPEKCDDNDPSQKETAQYLQDLQQSMLSLASHVFTGAYEVLEVLLETCNCVINQYSEELEYRLQGLERLAKSTILGHLLPVLLTAMTHPNLQCLNISDQLMPQLVQLVVLTSQAALLLKSQVQAIRQDDLDSDEDVIDLIGKSINPERLEIVEREEAGFLAGLKIPAPWASGKSVESIHPVRDNYKFKETVHIPGARCLYLRFDPRCTSQYDYDKLIVYAGPNTNAKKVAEYGGNTFGFGSRSVLGSGWPKDLVKVEGDTVTFSFEMRSGREHNTPDKAMWGFLITVRAQESTEEVSCGLPFLADLALGLSVLACTMLHLLYQGPEKSPEEMACEHLLRSKLLQRCVWQTERGTCTLPLSPVKASPTSVPILEDTELKIQPQLTMLPRVRLPSDVVQKLRDMSARTLPQLRPSIKEALQPETLEESILSATIKHLSLSDIVHHLTTIQEQQSDDFWLLSNIMEEVYRRFDALLRQLQSLAELEQKWQTEVEDKHQEILNENVPFFHDYHLNESKSKELTMLCYLKGLELDLSDPENAVKNLREKFDEDFQRLKSGDLKTEPLAKVKLLVQGLNERLELLLQVTIAPKGDGSGFMTRSKSYFHEALKQVPLAMARSDTDVLKSSYSRSISAPSGLESAQDDSVIEIMKLQRKRQAQKKGPASILQDLVEEENNDRPPHVVLIDQLFSFIGSDPEKAVSCQNFLSSAKVRWKRGMTRKQALVHMKELLMAACRVGGATHLVAAVTSVLQHGPRVDELTCGGMVHAVREAFAETMTSVVQLAARYPIACCNSIGLLCIIPYTRAEEKCLVRCGLVHLLDKLCSLGNPRGESMNADLQTTRQKVSTMAWAGFKVLANRGVTWETEEAPQSEDLEHSGLARQVSVLLTNHLARATEGSGNEAAGNEALQEVLSLLNNLSRSHMGKAILSQPACVSKLLSLLLDQRPSPKLVLIILQLCRVALPLMTSGDCEKVDLPAWGQDIHAACSYTDSLSDPPSKIVSLLLAKLGDFLVPGDQVTVSTSQMSTDSLNGLQGAAGGAGMDKDKMEDSDIQDGRLSVFVHKREDQSSHEVIQPLLSSDNRPFRLGGGANMERVVRMDREMTKMGKAEVTTEDAMSALRRAAKWAQMGLVVSTGPPVDTAAAESTGGDKKKTATDVICKEKNAELARTDPVRPFISGHVANSMAAEVIALLHGLLTSPESSTAQTWADAVRTVLSGALSSLPILLSSVQSLGSPRCNPTQLMIMAKQADAALCALGGFKETIKPGCEVKITGDGIHNSSGQVLSVSGQTGLATVQLNPEPDDQYAPRYSDTVQIPLARLLPPRNENLALQRLPMSEAVISAVNSLLLPQDGACQLQQPLPMSGDGNSLVNQTCRVVTEIQSHVCKVLATYLQDFDFAKELIQRCGGYVIDTLKSLAKDCGTGDRVTVMEAQCERLRMLYRDCVKPPPPPSKTNNKNNKEITWDTSRVFPPVRSCLFSHSLTGITFFGDPSAGTGLPRGTMVYASQPIPAQAPSFYWELEVCSFGDTQEESSAVISFGFAPPAERKDGAWTNPVGTCLFLNNGKAVHYNGASLLQWKSVRLDACLNSGDVAGIGWERSEDSAPLQGQAPKGRVYFTYNGRRLSVTIDDVSGGMFPVVHIQKKNTRIRANFGARPFAFAEGQHHRDAADEHSDTLREIRESFGVLPFCPGSDSEGESPLPLSSSAAAPEGVKEVKTPPGYPCKVSQIPPSLKEYNSETFKQYKLLQSYDNFVRSGPDLRTQQANQEEASDDEETGEEQQVEDHYALLVKAWEQKVFPVIRRRFRNEAERKDGLEQIRGALQLGMTDIARQTVEFLYEENGGMPRDLHLPTIEDIKEDLAKFTIERVRKGTTVIVRNPGGGGVSGTTVLPKFAVRGMLRTFGLTGTVLDVDSASELVQVETYLRSEGVLVRYWYPIDMLEKPPQGFRKSSITGGQTLDTSNVLIHRELLRCESVLARTYCRTALLQLIDHCNSPTMEISSCLASLGAGMAASAALLQELDIENLQLLSNELLCSPQPHGGVVAQSLATSSSPWQCLAPHTCSLSDLIFTNPERLKEELVVAIARAANQGEDYLIELTTQLCICLQTTPEMFPFEEFPVTEVKVNTDVHFPGAACLVVSCKTDHKTAKKESSLYKSPWARIFCYNGHRVKKTGQATKQEVISFPRDTTSSSNQNDQYAPVILPTDCIHVKLGVSPPPGVTVTIHALPPQFLLAVTYLETLVSEKHGCGTRSCGNQTSSTRNSAINLTEPPTLPPQASLWKLEKIVITPPVFLHAIELIGTYLWRTEIPAMIKEYVFHILAQTLRVLLYSDSGISTLIQTLSSHLSPSQGVLAHLQTELKKLYDEETKNWTTLTTSAGTGMGIGACDQGRFTTYFHSLVEVCLAIAEVTAPPPGTARPGGPSMSSTDLASGSSMSAMPASPTGAAKRKKLKTKKERGSGVSRHSLSPKSSESETALTVCPSSSQSSVGSGGIPSSSPSSSSPPGPSLSSTSAGGSGPPANSITLPNTKLEDILWFHRAMTVSQILRYLIFEEPQGESVMMDAISDASQSLVTPTAHTRMLVISGIPPHLDAEFVKKTIRKVCSSVGGLFRDEIFVPLQTISKKSGTSPPVHVSPKPVTSFSDVLTPAPSPSAVSNEPSSSERSDTVKEHKKLSAKCLTRGYAVIELSSKTKVEAAKKALYKCKPLVEGLPIDADELVDVSEDVMSVSIVGQNLVSDPQAIEPIELFLLSKVIHTDRPEELTDGATIALTEIFHSCFISEQRVDPSETRQESGYICLSKDQIVSQTPGNLLGSFFNHIRQPKKSVADQVVQALRKYGFSRPADKEGSSPTDKNGKGRGPKKSTKPSKEKAVLGPSEKTAVKERKPKTKESVEKVHRESGAEAGTVKPTKVSSREEEKLLTLDGFLQLVVDLAKQDIRSVWRALLSCGFDIHFDRCACIDNTQAQQMAKQWTMEMDCALVNFINFKCRRLAICPARLHPHEVYITEPELANERYACLQGVPTESLRLRFTLLQSLNNSLETFFLPLIDLRPADTFTRSTGAILSQARGLLFYDTKVNFINRVLNATAKRKPDQAAPEISLDPLESIGGDRKDCLKSSFSQAFRQLAGVSSSQLCVRLAAGGDPTYSFNVRLTGEEVHGTSGSFRHFLWQIAGELQSPVLNLLVLCTNSSQSSGKWITKPGQMTYAEEQLLRFLGQMLGITVRADIPFGLDLLSVFWKTIVGVAVEPVTDLKEADSLTYNYIKKLEMAESEPELLALCSDVYNRFVYPSLTGEEIGLVPAGACLPISWSNRQEYVDAIRKLRKEELTSQERVTAIRAGLATIIPLQLLSVMTPLDMEIRACGMPAVNLHFLKSHTMYQVGLMETDPHIEYFWGTLEGLSQDDLCRFIKFACNQERIPQSCPCKDGSADTAHVPPYPMKIAPPDGPGNPDARYIRAETCMFMIKLPQYSSQEIMTQRLTYAIHCREDPLSG